MSRENHLMKAKLYQLDAEKNEQTRDLQKRLLKSVIDLAKLKEENEDLKKSL
jgi:hypothetical protein